MKSYLYILLIVVTFAACSKKDQPPYEKDPFELEWLQQKKEQLSPCVCLMRNVESTYKGQIVFEVQLIDPACDGINIVYDENGTQLFHSAPAGEYQDYFQTATNKKVIWTCSRGK